MSKYGTDAPDTAQGEVSAPPRRKRSWGQENRFFPALTRMLPVEEWSVLHRSAWERACFRAGPLDPPGGLAHYGDLSLQQISKAWGSYVSSLAVAGDLSSLETPGQCLTADRLTRFISSLRERVSPTTTRKRIHLLFYAINGMAPERDWQWVRHHPLLPREAEAQAARKRIVPHDPRTLLEGALDYCDGVDGLPQGPRNSIKFRDGLLVAFGTYFAIRRKNLAEILMSHHLLIGDEVSRLVFDDSVKNGECIDSLVPDTLLRYIDRYLTHHRKILLRHHPDVQSFWISWDGRPMTYATPYFVFQRMGVRLIGRPISVHSVRYAAATTILDENPHDIEIASAALAHRGTSSVSRVYDKGGAARANRIWAKIRRRRR